ncbi:hypothetical protein GUITHDRAFT_101578 [Guillardia theta CCMP2712]|uniref:Uncharacterized protein n=1 Tax=Guillardia theta (strain CCMP2712) TaxID=905079 RepID=L1JYH4_GUITC|nr:hypothetical protein GUITHDRAFT_101578 [Guillardia theta CCMP2712]EKX53143.1 hypothetical protein GUITHDRAFT_101578 [Guillardia theta CCMP2712]|eukprot:XP_005840123.1 hypothetical protein GUITHDRAFT_101578 [Guillardia theta CCMP2712]
MEEDLNTKSWNGSKLCIFLGSTEDAQRRMMKELPFYLEGAATSKQSASTGSLRRLEAESDDIERRSLSFLFIALSKFAEMHVLACSLKVDKKDRLRVEMREDDEEEEDFRV